MATPVDSKLDKAKHITYWKRCLKTYLPHHYTSMDANRTMLAYFTILALDLLDALDSTINEEERKNCLEWVYICQHPDGGFRGSPGARLQGREVEHNKEWDVASVPATYFALSMLAMLGDDFSRVDRTSCLRWLRKVQRSDGSFGEHLGEAGAVEGGMDTRFGFCAMGIRWMLRGKATGEVDGVPDVDVDALITCIQAAQTFDGSISEMPFHEPHGGYLYCALAALALIDGLPPEIQNHHYTSDSKKATSKRPVGLSDVDYTTRWLLFRQTALLEQPDLNDSESDSEEDDSPDQPLQYAGFNGRCNKIADTCYAWWVGGSLAILNRLHFSNIPLSRAYLCEKTQHRIGGFGKKVGDPPDVYHSALGLAALALMGEAGLKAVEPALCLSKSACAFVEGLGWRREIEGKGESS